MSALAGVPHQPIVAYWISVTDDLRRATSNQAGRELDDEEVALVIHADIQAMIEKWRAIGQWLDKVDQQDAYDAEIARRRTLFPERMRADAPIRKAK